MSPDALAADPVAALDGLDLPELDALPVAEHAPAYDELHERLQQTLTSLDEL